MWWRAVAREDEENAASLVSREPVAIAAVGPRALETGASHSGRERNHFFLSLEGEQFKDVSGISGLDDIADGRAFTLLDFDRDGWQDVALVNANAPLFELFRNRIGEIDGPGGAERARVVALRFVGGNRAAEPAEGLSARDGFGARVRLENQGERRLSGREQPVTVYRVRYRDHA